MLGRDIAPKSGTHRQTTFERSKQAREPVAARSIQPFGDPDDGARCAVTRPRPKMRRALIPRIEVPQVVDAEPQPAAELRPRAGPAARRRAPRDVPIPRGEAF